MLISVTLAYFDYLPITVYDLARSAFEFLACPYFPKYCDIPELGCHKK